MCVPGSDGLFRGYIKNLDLLAVLDVMWSQVTGEIQLFT